MIIFNRAAIVMIYKGILENNYKIDKLSDNELILQTNYTNEDWIYNGHSWFWRCDERMCQREL